MDLKIGSINVRGLGDNQKGREIFNWLKAKNFSIYFFKKFTVPKAQHQSGRLNGDMKPYLAVARVQKADLQFSLRTNSKGVHGHKR